MVGVRDQKSRNGLCHTAKSHAGISVEKMQCDLNYETGKQLRKKEFAAEYIIVKPPSGHQDRYLPYSPKTTALVWPRLSRPWNADVKGPQVL